jgi:hypothetical protein
MKSLKQYIFESVHTYNCTIKIAGEVDKNFLDLFTYNLKKFDPIEISSPTTTPIQKDPYGFPNLANVPVTIIKGKFRYPATEPMVQQMAQLLGYNVDMVRVVNTNYDDSINVENEEYENQMKESPLLTHEEMGSAAGAEQANKDYSNSYLNSIKDQTKSDKIGIPYASKETPNAFDPFKPYLDDKQLGDKSPMSKISRPPKPKTGAMV